MPIVRKTSEPQLRLYWNNGSNCGQPLRPLLWVPTPCPAPVPIPEGSSFPGGPGGCGEARPEEEGTFSVPPRSCLLLLGLPGKPRDRSESEESVPGFGEGTPCAEPLPSPDPEQGEIQGDDPNRKQLPLSSQRTSQRGRVGKGSERRRPRCHCGFIFSLSVSIQFLFHCSLP